MKDPHIPPSQTPTVSPDLFPRLLFPRFPGSQNRIPYCLKSPGNRSPWTAPIASGRIGRPCAGSSPHTRYYWKSARDSGALAIALSAPTPEPLNIVRAYERPIAPKKPGGLWNLTETPREHSRRASLSRPVCLITISLLPLDSTPLRLWWNMGWTEHILTREGKHR